MSCTPVALWAGWDGAQRDMLTTNHPDGFIRSEIFCFIFALSCWPKCWLLFEQFNATIQMIWPDRIYPCSLDPTDVTHEYCNTFCVRATFDNEMTTVLTTADINISNYNNVDIDIIREQCILSVSIAGAKQDGLESPKLRKTLSNKSLTAFQSCIYSFFR